MFKAACPGNRVFEDDKETAAGRWFLAVRDLHTKPRDSFGL